MSKSDKPSDSSSSERLSGPSPHYLKMYHCPFAIRKKNVNTGKKNLTVNN